MLTLRFDHDGIMITPVGRSPRRGGAERRLETRGNVVKSPATHAVDELLKMGLGKGVLQRLDVRLTGIGSARHHINVRALRLKRLTL